MPLTRIEIFSSDIAARAQAGLPARLRRERWLRRGAGLGATVVLFAITAIPVYLLWQLWPLSTGAGSETLWPLLLGSLKATLYATLFGVPLALGAAIHNAQFGQRGMRPWLRAALEILNALPSVLLGLVAVAWLAPRLYTGLDVPVLGGLIFLSLLVTVAFADRGRERGARSGDTYRAWLVFLPVPLAIGLALVCTHVFGTGTQSGITPATPWNSLLVGSVLGLAIVPSVFATAEDALLGVPSALAHGAYALGATRWQALSTLILPAAGSGLLAAVLLGIGRALGESMIVLMASGNTPVSSWHAFDGLRAITANIAIQAPQAAPHGEQFRLLLLSALVLFGLTFVLHSLAALLRGRLRQACARL